MPEAWPHPPAPHPALGPREVHVWRIPLQPPEPTVRRLEATLSDDERARAARFRFPAHRVAYVAGRGVLRALLGRYLGTDPRAVRFGYTAHGKPHLAPVAGGPDLRFNLSNTETLALAAFALGRDLGVDLERVKPMPDAADIAARFFSAPENEAFRAVPPASRELAFFTCWTRKEAYIKAVGEGLSMPLDRFDVAFAPGEPARLLATRPDPAEAARWTLRELEPGEGHVGALMAAGSDWSVATWHWPGDHP
ncbi:MAG: phosphopantetheinyl transferase [Gemmatimonadetes bacterium]|nr:phosphopantetheinyl transferase [Gemmatimonadota bacterium]